MRFPVCPCGCRGREWPGEVGLFALGVFVCATALLLLRVSCSAVCTECVFVFVFVCARARALSEASRRCAPTLAGRGTAVADHYRQGDSGSREFSGVCLRLASLLNERCSISLIMPPLRLMSLLSDSKVCKKAPLLSGLFAFLIGLNERACLSSCPAIHSPRSGWRCV